MLCRVCRLEDHKDHRCTSLVAEADALRREFTAFKRENRKVLIERNKDNNCYDVENMRREANDRAEALKERLIAKVDDECRWFLKQLGDGGVTLSPAQSVSSIADSGSVAGSVISDSGDPSTTPLKFSSAVKENKELNNDDEETCVTEDETTLCDDLKTVHFGVDENLDLLEDLPIDDNTRGAVIGLQAPKKFPTVDFLHSFGKYGQFWGPEGLTICPKGTVIVADSLSHRVQLFDINGKWEGEISTRNGGVTFPSAVACRSLNSKADIFVTCPGMGEVLKLPCLCSRKVSTELYIAGCKGVAALDKGHTLIFSERVNNTVAIYARGRDPVSKTIKYMKTNTIKSPLSAPRNINTDGLSNIYVSDIGDGTVKVLDNEGRLKVTIGKDILRCPKGVCVDKEGNVIVADHWKNTLEIFASDGHHLDTLVAKQEGLKSPQEIALTPDGTKLVVVDGGNHCVLVYKYNHAGNKGVLTNKNIRD
ncbi:tripartite motif-containing protein 2-like [Branchiostoma floridae]|uniref:Tripartite motif-containing protein 2-like n=1 Tax=Branchiostoma floridae TaxID=7739 RepID=A0A9J7M7X6_BRAFL|nr:tripartite motif-containing protein 2-like [Branchiostoma floridae]